MTMFLWTKAALVGAGLFWAWGATCAYAQALEPAHSTQRQAPKPKASLAPTTAPPSPAVPIRRAHSPVPAAPALGPELTEISTMLADGKREAVVLKAWNAYVTGQVRAKQPLDVDKTIAQVQRHAEAIMQARVDAQMKRRAGLAGSLGDDAQLANLDLQNALQRQQQAMQSMTQTSKSMHDTAMAIIRNLK